MSDHLDMDKVDQKQQEDITRLQEIDKRHDNMIKAIAVFSMVLIVMFIFTLVLLSNREIQCPHKDCPHYIGNIQN